MTIPSQNHGGEVVAISAKESHRSSRQEYYWSMAKKIKGNNIFTALCQAMSEEDQRDYEVQRESLWLLSWQKKKS